MIFKVIIILKLKFYSVTHSHEPTNKIEQVYKEMLVCKYYQKNHSQFQKEKHNTTELF